MWDSQDNYSFSAHRGDKGRLDVGVVFGRRGSDCDFGVGVCGRVFSIAPTGK
jgi:hypothetical protein